jgi:hypothetical protein
MGTVNTATIFASWKRIVAIIAMVLAVVLFFFGKFDLFQSVIVFLIGVILF